MATSSNSTRIALVTGGMGGIGTAISQRLHQDGFTVVVGCSPYSSRKASWMAKQLEAGFHFHCIDCDITDWDSTRQAFEMVRENVGRLMYWSTMRGSPETVRYARCLPKTGKQ